MKGLVSSILVSAENLKLVEIDWWVKSMIFASYQNLDTPKIPINAIILDLSRHSKLSSPATTGFISFTKVAIEDFLRFRIKYW